MATTDSPVLTPFRKKKGPRAMEGVGGSKPHPFNLSKKRGSIISFLSGQNDENSMNSSPLSARMQKSITSPKKPQSPTHETSSPYSTPDRQEGHGVKTQRKEVASPFGTPKAIISPSSPLKCSDSNPSSLFTPPPGLAQPTNSALRRIPFSLPPSPNSLPTPLTTESSTRSQSAAPSLLTEDTLSLENDYEQLPQPISLIQPFTAPLPPPVPTLPLTPSTPTQPRVHSMISSSGHSLLQSPLPPPLSQRVPPSPLPAPLPPTTLLPTIPPPLTTIPPPLSLSDQPSHPMSMFTFPTSPNSFTAEIMKKRRMSAPVGPTQQHTQTPPRSISTAASLFKSSSSSNKLIRAKNELLESEKSYFEVLFTILHDHCDPLHHSLSDRELFLIFGNIKELYSLSLTFVSVFEQWIKRHPGVLLHQIFGQHSLLLQSAMIAYCDHYNRLQSQWTRLINPNTSQHDSELKKTGHHLLTHLKGIKKSTHELQSLLIAPCQRVMRYRMLLSEILKHMDASDLDRSDVEHSLKYVEVFTENVNNYMAKLEVAYRCHAATQEFAEAFENGSLFESEIENQFVLQFQFHADVLGYEITSPEDSVSQKLMYPVRTRVGGDLQYLHPMNHCYLDETKERIYLFGARLIRTSESKSHGMKIWQVVSLECGFVFSKSATELHILSPHYEFVFKFENSSQKEECAKVMTSMISAIEKSVELKRERMIYTQKIATFTFNSYTCGGQKHEQKFQFKWIDNDDSSSESDAGDDISEDLDDKSEELQCPQIKRDLVLSQSGHDPAIDSMYQTLTAMEARRDSIPNYEQAIRVIHCNIVQRKRMLCETTGEREVWALTATEEEWAKDLGEFAKSTVTSTPKRKRSFVSRFGGPIMSPMKRAKSMGKER
jgi:hypothetical protein